MSYNPLEHAKNNGTDKKIRTSQEIARNSETSQKNILGTRNKTIE